MEASTITTLVLVLAGLGVLALAGYGWYLLLFTDIQGLTPGVGSQPRPVQSDDDIEAAVREMRRAIEEYERRQD